MEEVVNLEVLWVAQCYVLIRLFLAGVPPYILYLFMELIRKQKYLGTFDITKQRAIKQIDILNGLNLFILENCFIYRLMIGKKSIFILIVTLLGISTFVDFSNEAKEEATVGDIDMTCGFSADFAAFLAKSIGCGILDYSNWDFSRNDLKCAAYGGKNSSKDKSSKAPIVFVHGNSDIAFGRGTQDGYVDWQTGFRSLITYLGTQGYQKQDLYATTWGPANPNAANQNNHAKKYILQMRAFLQAVLAYTKADHVNVIGHSMGVTIGRKIVQGGQAIDQKEGSYQVGPSLKSKVKNFIGLAGANLGLTACWNLNTIPTCSNVDGFNPGALATSGPSKLFAGMNSNPSGEAENVYVIWSKNDNIIGTQCVVWGKVTCRIPGQKDEVVHTELMFDHFKVRDATGSELIKWLT